MTLETGRIEKLCSLTRTYDYDNAKIPAEKIFQFLRRKNQNPLEPPPNGDKLFTPALKCRRRNPQIFHCESDGIVVISCL